MDNRARRPLTFNGTSASSRLTGEDGPATLNALVPGGTPIQGYELHVGVSEVGLVRPFARIRPKSGGGEYFDGAVATDGLVFGTYVHGPFRNPAFLRLTIRSLARRRGIRVPPNAAEDGVTLSRWFRGGADVDQILSWLQP